ncbi:MAG TPA: AMP-binding protein, partial [Burkholderiales bacterium]|nr:AMP-binding protein [Burkholderiales bacterium]
MKRAHLLDRLIGAELPEFPTDKELRAFEATPYDERIAAHSTYEALKIGAAQDPQAPAIHFLQRCEPDETPLTITHAEFLAKVTQTANLLADLGVGPRDVVSFMLPLLPQSFHTLFGAEAAGIANPVNSLLEPVQIAEILRAAGTKVLVALAPAPGTDIWQKVERVRRELPGLKAILQVNGPGDEPNGVYSYDALLAKYPSDRLASGRRIAADDVAAYFHTGGTTGTPKLVRHTHRNQVYQAWVCNLVLRSKPGRKILFGLPLYHVGGALTQGLTTFAGGGAVVVLSPSGWRNQAAVKNIWKLVERYKPEIFGGVPTVLAASLHIPVAGADISSLRYASGGGSAIPVAVGKGLQQQLGVPVLEVYGMTETSSVHTIAYTGRPVRLGSVGHAVPYSKVRVVRIDASGRFAGDCAANEIGVVAMAGPGVFSGYLSESHNRGAFVEPGWVNSGDLGRLDEDGYLWITGRAKDLIIRGGHNIDPLPVEEILFGLPLYHVGGALTQGLTTFAGGGAVVVLSPSGWRNQTAVKNIWKLVERYKPEIFGGVPTVLAASLHIAVAGADISSLRYASGGGSAIPVAVGKGLQQQLGVPVLEVYGMTETSSVHTIAYTGRPVRLGSVGHAVP